MFEELLVQNISTGITEVISEICSGKDFERTFIFDTDKVCNTITVKASLDLEHKHARANLKFRTRIK